MKKPSRLNRSDRAFKPKGTVTEVKLIEEVKVRRNYKSKKEARMITRDVIDTLTELIMEGYDINIGGRFSIFIDAAKCRQIPASMYLKQKSATTLDLDPGDKVFVGKKPNYTFVLSKNLRKEAMENISFGGVSFNEMLADEESETEGDSLDAES